MHCCIGGRNVNEDVFNLEHGTHVVSGTPGRVFDMIRRRTFRTNSIKMFVLDEADEMLRMGFIDDVKWVLSHTPEHCQRLLFSATMHLKSKTCIRLEGN